MVRYFSGRYICICIFLPVSLARLQRPATVRATAMTTSTCVLPAAAVVVVVVVFCILLHGVLCTRRRLLRRHTDVVCGFRFKVSLFRPFARLQRPTLPACRPACLGAGASTSSSELRATWHRISSDEPCRLPIRPYAFKLVSNNFRLDVHKST